MTTNVSHEEFVEYATFLYGSEWRDHLSTALNITRRQLVLSLASDEAIPADLVLRTLNLVKDHLQVLKQDQARIAQRVDLLSKAFADTPEADVQPRASRSKAG